MAGGPTGLGTQDPPDFFLFYMTLSSGSPHGPKWLLESSHYIFIPASKMGWGVWEGHPVPLETSL